GNGGPGLHLERGGALGLTVERDVKGPGPGVALQVGAQDIQREGEIEDFPGAVLLLGGLHLERKRRPGGIADREGYHRAVHQRIDLDDRVRKVRVEKAGGGIYRGDLAGAEEA